MVTKKEDQTERIDNRLYRSETNRIIAGVCGGLGEYFKIDPTIIRIIFVVLALVFHGSGILIYILLWIIIPRRSALAENGHGHMKENLDEMRSHFRSFASDIHFHRNGGARVWWGVLVILLGVIFLLNNFGYPLLGGLDRAWPLILIIVGLFFLFRR